MEIKDINGNQGNVDIVAEVVAKDEPRTFEKFGKSGRVCNAKLKDASGEVKLTLWNDDIEKVNVGDRIHLEKGWCSEYKGEKQVSSGKFGKIEILESTGKKNRPESRNEAGSETVFTNSEDLAKDLGKDTAGDAEDDSEFVEEELIE